MNQMLSDANLTHVHTAGDGACLYWATGVSAGRLQPSEVLESPILDPTPESASTMAWMMDTRRRVVTYIDEHRDVFRNSAYLFEDWSVAGRTRRSASVTERVFKPEENEKHLQATVWGGCDQIRALASVLGVDIVVIMPTATVCVQAYLADSETDIVSMLWTDALARLRGQVAGARTLVPIFWNGANHFSALLPPTRDPPSTPKTAQKPKHTKRTWDADALATWLLARLHDPALSPRDLFVLPPGVLDSGTKFDKAGLRKRYLKISMSVHPDKHGNAAEYTAAFQRLQDAYDKLSSEGEASNAGTPDAQSGAGADGAAGEGSKKRKERAAPPPPPKAPSDPATAAWTVEDEGADADAAWECFWLSITAGFRKRRGNAYPELSEKTRSRLAQEMVDAAHLHHPALENYGLCTMYNDSREKGTDGRYQFASHLQGVRKWRSRGGAELAVRACETYYRACFPADSGATLHLLVKVKGDDQEEGDLFVYPDKQRKERHWHNHHGGSEYDAQQHQRWQEEADERHANVHSTGFKKSGFTWTANSSKLKVNNGNFASLVINFCRRHQLEGLGASLLRRAGWMLQSGNYELEASLVCGRYGGAADRARLEAFAVVNESPQVCRTPIRPPQIYTPNITPQMSQPHLPPPTSYLPTSRRGPASSGCWSSFYAGTTNSTCSSPRRTSSTDRRS